MSELGDGPPLVGRDAESAALEGFLGDSGPEGLVITGPAGIGKSVLFELAVAGAPRRGYRVLVARPGEGERDRSHAVLRELLRGLDTSDLDEPLAAALEVVLLRRTADGPPDPAVVETATRSLLDDLAADRPVLVALDDTQWADLPSVRALCHVLRQRTTHLRWLLVRRTDSAPTTLEETLRRHRHVGLEVGPLGADALAQVVAGRVGLRLPRWAVSRLAAETGGSPLLALEIAHVLRQRGLPPPGGSLGAHDPDLLLRERALTMPEPLATVLLAAALEPTLGDDDVVRLSDQSTLDEACRSRVLAVDAVTGQARPWHPLLGAAALDTAAPTRRRRVHRRLAACLRDADLAVRHRGLGTTGADRTLAAELAEAATAASRRGASETAVELAELALARTPNGARERPDRVLALADALAHLGSGDRLRDLLERELERLPAGEARARARLLLLETDVGSAAGMQQIIERALAEPGLPAPLRAHALSLQSATMAVIEVAEIAEALELAEQAHALDPAADTGLVWCRALRALPVSGGSAETQVRHAWRGELDVTRTLLAAELEQAARAGAHLRHHDLQRLLVETALRAGDADEAGTLLDQWLASGETDLLESPEPDAFRARLAALRGDPDAALPAARAAIAAGERIGKRWAVLDAQVTCGLAAVLADDGTAVARLGEVWERCRRAGVVDPGVFPVAMDLLHALIAANDLDAAEVLLGELDAGGRAQPHPWAGAVAAHGTALLGLRRGGPADEAVAVAGDAADDLDRAGTLHDAARARLALARELRRRRRWASARAVLVRAAEDFERLGATGWAARAVAERGSLGGHRSATRDRHGLTPREAQVLTGLTRGMTDAEIARELHLSTKTVGHHVSAVLAKLGVANRREAARVARPDDGRRDGQE